MRDRELFTKAVMAGDAYFDLDLGRFVLIDIAGSFVVRGAIMGAGNPQIILSEGKVAYKSTLREEPVAAAAPKEPSRDK
jgi:hypothetical protein